MLFRSYSNTTPRTFHTAAALTAAGAEPALVTDRLYQRRPPEALLTLGNGYLATRGASPRPRPTTCTIPPHTPPGSTTGWNRG